MKKLLGLLLLMMVNMTYADEEHIAKLNVSLKIKLDCVEGEWCGHFPLNYSHAVKLKPSNLGELCDLVSGVCTDKPYLYRGIYSEVQEKNGIRYMAVVSINKFIYESPETGIDDYSYHITGEILSDTGIVAKLSITVDRLKELNTIDLEGPVVSKNNRKMQPVLTIGTAKCDGDGWLNICPGDSTDGDIGELPTKQNYSAPKINLILGTLRE